MYGFISLGLQVEGCTETQALVREEFHKTLASPKTHVSDEKTTSADYLIEIRLECSGPEAPVAMSCVVSSPVPTWEIADKVQDIFVGEEVEHPLTPSLSYAIPKKVEAMIGGRRLLRYSRLFLVPKADLPNACRSVAADLRRDLFPEYWKQTGTRYGEIFMLHLEQLQSTYTAVRVTTSTVVEQVGK